MQFALITGATSGIGLSFAKLLSQKGVNLILVSRNAAKMNSIKNDLEQRYNNAVECLSCDLSIIEDVLALKEKLNDKEINLLINNAGIGYFGDFASLKIEDQLKIMNLNMNGLVTLTHIVTEKMIKVGKGDILNVASTAAFQSGPFMAVYYATKAFVLNFSEAIRYELKSKGINVSVLCPGPTQTDFFHGNGFENMSNVRNTFVMQSADEVAANGLKAVENKKAIVISGLGNKLVMFLGYFTPRAILTKVMAKINS